MPCPICPDCCAKMEKIRTTFYEGNTATIWICDCMLIGYSTGTRAESKEQEKAETRIVNRKNGSKRLQKITEWNQRPWR